MQITGITPEQFTQIVRKVAERDYEGNLAVDVSSVQSATRFRGRVILRTTGNQMGLKNPELAPAQRRSGNGYGKPRRINAVCWHAFRDVFTELFDQYPDARIYTGLAKYRGRSEFYANYPATAHRNIGSMMYPMTMPETCDCS